MLSPLIQPFASQAAGAGGEAVDHLITEGVEAGEGAGVAELADGGGGTPLDGITDVAFGYQFACARDKQKSLHCWGNSEHGTVLAARAFTNFNSASGAPSSPIASYTANGTEGYDTRLRYLTTSGVLVYGSSKKTPICP